MYRVIILEKELNSKGKAVIIDKEILNVCKICVFDYKGSGDVHSIEESCYDADCDDCGDFERGSFYEDVDGKSEHTV